MYVRNEFNIYDMTVINLCAMLRIVMKLCYYANYVNDANCENKF